MTGDGYVRVATAAGALLIAAADLAAFQPDGEPLFTPEYWQARGALQATARGRGSSWFVTTPAGEHWALRHCRRGGWLALHAPLDHYLWRGEEAVRSFVEWRLLAALRTAGLPVPEPVAARYVRCGPTYRCDLITRRIDAVEPLSDLLSAGPVAPEQWRMVGATVAQLHHAGCDHADLNAHNILVAADGRCSIVDFDRGRLRSPGAWRAANLRRLHRSLRKVSADHPAGRFTTADWRALLAGYQGACR